MNEMFNNGKVFCTKCGAENKAGYRFCVRCGAKLMSHAASSQPENRKEPPKTECVIYSAEIEQMPLGAELMQEKNVPRTFSAFEETDPQVEPIKPEAETVQAEPVLQTFSAFDETDSQMEPIKPEAETVQAEPVLQTFSVFEETDSQRGPIKPEVETVQAEPVLQTFSAFEETVPQEEPSDSAGFAKYGSGEVEAGMKGQDTEFARSGFTGTTTPTARAGAFTTAVDAVRYNKKIDISDAETVMSLLEQNESSALAEGLPAWDIVPPQVVVRRKHRL